MDTLIKVCTCNAKKIELCTLSNNFRRWTAVRSEELEFLWLKEAQRKFHARFSSIVEPLLQKVPPTLLIPALEVIFSP